MDKRRNRRPLHGQVMILFAVGAIVLIGVVALAVDVGFLLAERRQNQAAVDSAAMSAAVAVLDKKTDAEVEAAGQSYGAVNAGVLEESVDVEWPAPGSDAHSGVEYVRVTIIKDVRKFFLGAIYGGSWQVTNTAVAGVESVPKPYALIALNCPGIAVSGNIKLYIDGEGSVMSNCNITNSGNSSIISAGGTIDANGTIQQNDGWVADAFNEGVRKAPNPLENAVAPPEGESQEVPDCLSDNVCLMPAGHYDNLGTITVKNTVCLTGGTYYLSGNTRINFQNTNSLLTSESTLCPANDGVLIYVTGTARIDMGNGKLNIATSYPDPCLPEDAPYEDATCGMVLWIANGSTFDGSGNASATFDGVVYAPLSTVSLKGTPGSHGLQVIVGNLNLSGTPEFTINYREYVKANSPAVFLVE